MKIPSTVAPHIDIGFDESYQADFPEKVNEALTRIASGTTGNRLIEELKPFSKKGRRVTIQAVGINTACRPALSALQARKFGISDDEFDPANNEKATQLAQKRPFGLKGVGSAATVDWNPNQGLGLDREGVPVSVDNSSKAYLALAHEMIHARRIVKGTFTGGTGDRYDPSSRSGQEELRAVGLDTYASKTPSENSIRQEQREPLRTTYAIRDDASDGH